MSYYSNPRFSTPANQGGPLIRSFLEADSQTFKAGQLVYLNSNGKYITAAASNATTVLGIAKKDATNVSTGHIYIPVEIIRPGDEIEIDVLLTATDADAAETQLLQNFALDVTSNQCKLDLDDTGNDLMTLQKIVSTTTVIVTFLASTLQYCKGY